jgi:hypothetical protein
MALFGSLRDINTFKSFSRELTEDVISQQCGYHKLVLSATPANIYGESMSKTFIGPVLLVCLIERGDFDVKSTDFSVDSVRTVNFRFLKDHLVEANVVPEVGDVIMYNELYYEVDNVNENQFIIGKNNDYAYSTGLENFGSSYSITCETHLTSPDNLGIDIQRL